MSGGITPNLGLSVKDVMNVTTSFTPIGAAARNFAAAMIIGSTKGSPGGPTLTNRVKQYSTIDEVGVDFATTDPEYIAAELFFGQSPTPNLLYISYWGQNETTPETFLQGITAIAQASTNWYMATVATATPPADSDYESAAAYIEAASPVRQLWATSNAASIVDPTSTTDLAYTLNQSKYNRTAVMYHSTNPYAAAGLLGIPATVNFTGSDTMLTLMFKEIVGLTPDVLTETAAGAASAKGANVYVEYNNGIGIVQHGTMASGLFFDELQGADWLANDIGTAGFNALLTFPKIPQTDAGVTTLVSSYEGPLDDARNNGYIAPGVWNGPNIGALKNGQYLTKGSYIYVPSVNTQSESVRQSRVAPTAQMAIKLAGAIHDVNVTININQ